MAKSIKNSLIFILFFALQFNLFAQNYPQATLLKDFYSGANGSSPNGFVQFKGKIYSTVDVAPDSGGYSSCDWSQRFHTFGENMQ